MEIVGSNINSSLAGVNEMLNGRDAKKLMWFCKEQLSFGADRIDLNCGSRVGTEVEDMEWMVRTIRKESDVPLMVDSPNPDAIEVALRYNGSSKMIVDSITCEPSRIESIMPLVKRYGALVVVLLHGASGMPGSLAERLELMKTVKEVEKAYDMNPKEMLLDSLIFPLSMNDQNGLLYLDCLRQLKRQFPEYAYTCGLSNISYGMPQTELLDISYASMLLGLQQEYLFMELNANTAAFIYAFRALLGKDENTFGYLHAFRSQALNVLQKAY